MHHTKMKMDKKELAMQLHDKNYNCAQCVVCAFEEEAGVKKELLFRMAEGFGLGMGGANQTCGALTGAILLAGLKNSDANLEAPNSKASTYRISATLEEKFKEKTGETICRKLKGLDTGVPICSCNDCITAGIEIVEEYLWEK